MNPPARRTLDRAVSYGTWSDLTMMLNNSKAMFVSVVVFSCAFIIYSPRLSKPKIMDPSFRLEERKEALRRMSDDPSEENYAAVRREMELLEAHTYYRGMLVTSAMGLPVMLLLFCLWKYWANIKNSCRRFRFNPPRVEKP
jgi:hypothetical protein